MSIASEFRDKACNCRTPLFFICRSLKTPGDIILHMCTTNENVWFFAPLTTRKNLKNQSFEKMTKTPGDIIFYKRNHMQHCSWEMMCDRCNLYFHFGLFLPFYATDSPQKKQNKKYKKIIINPLEISSFYTCIQKIMITICMVPEMWCTADRWTDMQTEVAFKSGGPI